MENKKKKMDRQLQVLMNLSRSKRNLFLTGNGFNFENAFNFRFIHIQMILQYKISVLIALNLKLLYDCD